MFLELEMTAVVELEVESSLPFAMAETKLIEKNNDVNVNSDLSSDMEPDNDEDHSESGLKDDNRHEQVKDGDGDDVLNEKGEDKELSVEQTKDDGGNEPDVGNQQVTLQTNHIEKEAELESYLDSLKPKPKKLSLKERLMAMPGYKDIKPILGGGNVKNNDIIILDEEINKRMKAKDQKRQQQIELLKDRFVRHCIAPPPKSVKGEHVKLK